MEGIAQTRSRYGIGNHRWLGDVHGLNTTEPGTLDGALFPWSKYPDGLVVSGTLLAKVTATGLLGPYLGVTDEVQTISITGAPTGGTFTLTYNGATTPALPLAATANQVQDALSELAGVGYGNVQVTGTGPWVVSFVGALANVDASAITGTGSFVGGTSPAVSVAETTKGGAAGGASNGQQTPVGILLSDQSVHSTSRNDVGLFVHGAVIRNRLPVTSGIDDAAVAALPHIRFRNI